MVAYLCDCCLGWVFYREDVSAAKATCEGAVLFFKHGKTLAKNVGRIFGMGLLSFVAIGGVFTGLFYGIANLFPSFFTMLASEIPELMEDAPEFLSTPAGMMLAAAALFGIIFWSVIHSAFVRPFILTGVLRNYIESGKNDIPTEASFSLLDGKSAKFDKLRKELA